MPIQTPSRNPAAQWPLQHQQQHQQHKQQHQLLLVRLQHLQWRPSVLSVQRHLQLLLSGQLSSMQVQMLWMLTHLPLLLPQPHHHQQQWHQYHQHSSNNSNSSSSSSLWHPESHLLSKQQHQ
jgi:hypothetical protein